MRQPKVIECCGEKLVCDEFTNTYPRCGSDYNWNGSLLAPRSQWGEETGECAADILVGEEALRASLEEW